MKLLVVSNLFPNAAEPSRSPFNFQQFSALAKFCDLKIVAPVPFLAHSKNELPSSETINGIAVFHPRYLAIPKVLRISHGPAFYLGIIPTLRRIQKIWDYEAILVAWAYPDAYGTAIAARRLQKRLFIKVHGSDINMAHRYWGRVPMICRALQQAEKVIAVSRPLKEKLAAMGIPEGKVVVIPNGLNKEKFFLQDRDECREKLGLVAGRKYILFIGNLTEVKGCVYLIQAFAKLNMPGVGMVVVGDGPLRKELEALTDGLGIRNRILFKGPQPFEDVPLWINAADILCLPSLNEGCPNVVLEALACGTKIVASNVGGVPDLLDTPDKGWLAKPADEDDLARQIGAALLAPWTRSPGRLTMSWEENANRLYRTLSYGQ